MDNVFGSHSKLINLLTSGRLVVLSVLVMSLFAASTPVTAQAISTYQPSTYSAVYTSACQSNCATRSNYQNYGYSSNYSYTGSYRGGYANYGSNYGYGYGSANYRNYNIGGMYRGYSPRIYSSYSNYYRSPSIGDYFGYFAGQYLQSRVNNRGNCVSANSCVVNRAVSKPNYSISPVYDNGSQTYSSNQYQNGNMSYQDSSAPVSGYSNDAFNYTEIPSSDYQEGLATYK